MAQKIFLDANVVISEGKSRSPTLDRLIDLAAAGYIEVYTTDLTKVEIAKKHIENELKVVAEFARPHVRKALNEITGAKLPAITKAQMRDVLHERYTKNIDDLFKQLEAKSLSIDSVKPSAVMDAYSNQKGFFGGEGKKDQFPDAFIFEALKQIASEKSPIIIVSNDGDFVTPVKETPHFSHTKTFADLFAELGLGIDAPDVEEFLDSQEDRIIELFDEQVSQWGIGVSDVQDGEIEESNVTHVAFDYVTAFRSIKTGDEILVTGVATVKADVTFEHPNWETAAWDSEDKVAIPFDDVTGETEVELEIRFSMSVSMNEDGKPETIDRLSFHSRFGLWASIEDNDYYR